MIEWVHANEGLVWALFVISVFTFVVTLLLGPILIVRVPHDYFSHERRHPVVLTRRHPVVRGALLVLRNTLAVILLIGGLAMLVLPGQGLLTIVAALVVADFPGKYRLERWIVSRRSIRNTINWLRRRAGRMPLVIDD
ncbi:MAG: PGPGW domain-containing protein [Wenzhouxiangellaceae bacterium]